MHFQGLSEQKSSTFYRYIYFSFQPQSKILSDLRKKLPGPSAKNIATKFFLGSSKRKS